MASLVTQGKNLPCAYVEGLCIRPSSRLRLAGDVSRGGLGDRPYHHLVDVDVWRSGNGPDDAIGYIGTGQWLHTPVDRCGALAVAFEPDKAEFRFDHPGCDLGHPNRLAHKLQPQRLADGTDGMLTRRVPDAAGVDLEPGHRAEVDDVCPWRAPKQGQEGLRHPQEADNVRLHHLYPIVIAALGQRLQPGGQPGIVDEHFDLAMFRLDGSGKGL